MMTAMPAQDIATKSQFAALVERHPSFVTRCIKERKIYGGALIGEGPNTRINVKLALQQLGRTLDPSQQLAQKRPVSASATALNAGELPLTEVGADQAATVNPAGVGGADSRDEFVRLRMVKLQQEIDRQDREDAIKAGELLVKHEVVAAIGRKVTPLVGMLDELPPVVARKLAERFGLDYAEALQVVRAETRGIRESWAKGLSAAAVETV